MQTQTATSKKSTPVPPIAPKAGKGATKARSNKPEPKVISKKTENGVTTTQVAPVPTKDERRAAAYARAQEKQAKRDAKAKERLERAEKRAAEMIAKAKERELKMDEERRKRQAEAEAAKVKRAQEAEQRRLQKQAEKAAAKAAKVEARTAPKFEIVFANADDKPETVPFRKAVEARSYMAKLMKSGIPFQVNPLGTAENEDEPADAVAA